MSNVVELISTILKREGVRYVFGKERGPGLAITHCGNARRYPATDAAAFDPANCSDSEQVPRFVLA